MYEKNRRKLIMEENVEADEVFRRRKKCWLSYGRALLTVSVLGLITVLLFTVTQSKTDEHSSRVLVVESVSSEDELVKKFNADEAAINKQSETKKRVERSVDGVNRESSSESKVDTNSLNDVNNENNPLMDNEHLKLIRRQQGSNPNELQHRHSDGAVYYFKGYKCVPIRKLPKSSPANLVMPDRKFGMLCCLNPLLDVALHSYVDGISFITKATRQTKTNRLFFSDPHSLFASLNG